MEVLMASELDERGLIKLPKETTEKVFDPTKHSLGNGVTVFTPEEIKTITYWKTFDITPAGKYFIYETIWNNAGRILWTIFAAAIGAAIALIVNNI